MQLTLKWKLLPTVLTYFLKENYPSMKLNQEQGRNVIRGFYNRGEEPFIINYLLGFGDKINMVQPDSFERNAFK